MTSGNVSTENWVVSQTGLGEVTHGKVFLYIENADRVTHNVIHHNTHVCWTLPSSPPPPSPPFFFFFLVNNLQQSSFSNMQVNLNISLSVSLSLSKKERKFINVQDSENVKDHMGNALGRRARVTISQPPWQN